MTQKGGPTRRTWRYLLALLLVSWGVLADLCLASPASAHAAALAKAPITAPATTGVTYRVGITSFRDAAVTLREWSPTLQYLSQQLPGVHFEAVPMTLPQLQAGAASQQVDFIITNPEHYILLESEYGVSRVATLVKRENGQTVNQFGGVIFCRSERSDIAALGDVRGKTIAAVDTTSFAAYLLQLDILQDFGVDVARERGVRFLGFPQDLVVQAVLKGQADVGFVRSGVLETMAREGTIHLQDLRVLHPTAPAGFPFQTSTRLYPEWPFAVTPHVPVDVTNRVVAALMLMPPDHAAAQQAHYYRWSTPLEYSGVQQLMQRHHVHPYDKPEPITLALVLRAYAGHIAVLVSAIALLLTGAVLRSAYLNRRLHASGQRLKTILETASDGIHILDIHGILVDANRAFLEVVGQDASIIGKPWIDAWNGEQSRDAMLRQIAEMIAKGRHSVFEIRHRRGDGTLIDVEVSATGIVIDGQSYLYAASRDISARKQAQARMRLAASVFTHSREAIAIMDASETIIEVNDSFTRISGFARADVLGQPARTVGPAIYSSAHYEAMRAELGASGHWSGEIWTHTKAGVEYVALLSLNAVSDAQGATQNYVASFTDITASKKHQEQLEHIAHYDMLTGLSNRVLLRDNLQHAMAQARRRGTMLAVAYLDLDGFKAVNDRYGHSVGDELLVFVAQRMKAVLRDGDTLARFGGDEFVAVLVDLEAQLSGEAVLMRLLSAASDPVQVGSVTLQVSASIGVSFYPQDDSDADLLIRHADHAMYAAKHAGKNRFVHFDIAHDARVHARHENLAQVAAGFAQREFVLHFQPKVNLRSGAVLGTEALIRWQHPMHGLLAPRAFLPAMEGEPLSIAVGEWVIASALAQMAAWQAQGLDLPTSVNIGAYQLQQPDFVDRLRSLLAAQPEVPAHKLQLEVLETSALNDMDAVGGAMRTCQALGVSFALDDFGTGYSSLTYLKHLPAEVLKIDQSFVRDMLEDGSDRTIVQGVVGLARAFARQVIAEGVETQAHAQALLDLGCEQAQGFGIARPMVAQALPQWVDQWQGGRRWNN